MKNTNHKGMGFSNNSIAVGVIGSASAATGFEIYNSCKDVVLSSTLAVMIFVALYACYESYNAYQDKKSKQDAQKDINSDIPESSPTTTMGC